MKCVRARTPTRMRAFLVAWLSSPDCPTSDIMSSRCCAANAVSGFCWSIDHVRFGRAAPVGDFMKSMCRGRGAAAGTAAARAGGGRMLLTMTGTRRKRRRSRHRLRILIFNFNLIKCRESRRPSRSPKSIRIFAFPVVTDSPRGEGG